MKKLFYLGAAGLFLFEIANVYFIMPMPGSQRIDSLDLAYFLHQWRWVFRGVFGAMLLAGLLPAFRASRWLALMALIAVGAVAYMFNVDMTADKMFLQPHTLHMAKAQQNAVKSHKLVLGIELNGQAKAYPIQFLGYHHQVLDTVGGQPVMVTYCTVCRTGRMFSPTVNGKPETFRLVGMDHFNAMFEDATTKSWWRQATGEAVAGPLKGTALRELLCAQSSLSEWLALHPNSLVMQPDTTFKEDYADMETYDRGRGRGKLTGTDSLSWGDKSWIVGIELDEKTSKAYDWNQLKATRLIHDQIGPVPVLLALAADTVSFFAFERNSATDVFELKNDTLFHSGKAWDLNGRVATGTDSDLKKIPAYQEFWHSWSTFHPHATRY